MKAIIVGATGFIGSAILRRALEVPEITSIVTLSRRELPAELAGVSTANPKIKNVVVPDFAAYSPEVIAELSGAEVCIWALGGRVPDFPDYATARAANVTYPHAGANALVTHAAPSLLASSGKKFRFVYCSGMFTEYDQTKKLWFLEESRKLKGAAESGLLEIEKQNASVFEVVIARPAGVLETGRGVQNVIYGSMGIGKGELAASMVEMAVKGAKKQITDSLELRARGRELLKQDKAYAES